MKQTLVLLATVFFSSVSFAEEGFPSGSSITLQTLVPQQTGSQPVTFAPKDSYVYKVSVKPNGDREYLAADGTVHHAFDKAFTNITWLNKPVPPEWRFTRLPPNGELRPGMQWTVPGWKTKTDCQNMVVNYTANSEVGPDVLIAVDGKDATVKSIKIKYVAEMPGCAGGTWKLTQEILFSQDFKEIVSNKTIGWDARNPMFLSGGNGFEVKDIQTTNKVAGVPNDKAN